MKEKKQSNPLGVRRHTLAQNTGFLLQHTRQCDPRLLLWYALIIILGTLLPVLEIYLPAAVIEQITIGAAPGTLVLTVFAFLLPAAVFSGLKSFLEKYAYFQKFKMNAYYLRKVAGKGMTTDYQNQENAQFRKLQTESFGACNGNYSALTQIYDIAAALGCSILGFAVYFGILTQLNLLFILFLAGTTSADYFLGRRILKWSEENSPERIGYQQKINYIHTVSGDARPAKDIRLYRMAVWLDKVYRQNMQALGGWYRRYTKKIFGVSIQSGLLALLRECAAYAYLLFLVCTGRLGAAEFVLYFGVVTGFSVWLGGIFEQLSALDRISLSVDYLRAYLEYPEQYRRTGGRDTAGLMGLPKKIELQNVHYRCPGEKEDTLKGISLCLEPSEHLAVVGLNGAGKTTLVKLICGLLDPTQGCVLYDGVDVREYDRSAYYRLFSAVFQQFSLLPLPVAQLVAETLPEDIDYEKVRRCLAKAGILEKIETLPKGSDSQFGKTIYDDGVAFSGGEVQKLLLARALYRDSPVMILDEPTAALDPIAENRLYEDYASLMQKRSAVFISHRLASTRFCSRILLLEDGKILEEGTHETLLSANGRYQELFETQARYYREHPGEKEAE